MNFLQGLARKAGLLLLLHTYYINKDYAAGNR